MAARESNERHAVFNRIFFRGVSAGLVGMAVLFAATVAGPAIARGAEVDDRYTTPISLAQQEKIMNWTLPNARYLRHVHPVRPHVEVASRATSRTSLTGDPQAIAHALLLREGGSEGE